MFQWLLPLTMYQGALVLVLAGPFCYFSLLSKSIPLFRGRNVKNYEWRPLRERWQIAVGTLHVLAYHPRGSKNKKKKVVVFPPAPLAKLAFLSVGWLDHLKCITSGQTGSPYTGFQIWHECNFKFLTSSPYAGFQIMCKCNFKVVAASLQPSCMVQNVGA